MIRIRPSSIAALAALTMLAQPALAQVPATEAPVPTISAELVSRLCPVTGALGLKLGAVRGDQPPELLRSLRRLPAEFAPFTEGELDTTAWSGRVAAITYRAVSPDGDVNDRLLEAFDDTMTTAGWTGVALGDTITPLSSLASRTLEREVEGPDGKRALLLEFDASGALGLRCGDPALLELDQRERDGTLEPGSLRPVAPQFDPALRLPEADACQSPAIRRLTTSPDKLDEDTPEVAAFAGAVSQESDRAQFDKRLNTWLEWKLLNSGKIDENRLVELRTKAAKQNIDGEMKSMMYLLELAADIADARENNDEFKACEAMRKFLVLDHGKLRAQHQYWTSVNAGLEAEAKRLAIALD